MDELSNLDSSLQQQKTSVDERLCEELTHDRFANRLFSQLFYARLFLERFLPADILCELDLDTLELMPTRFVDSFGKSNIADVFYQVQLKRGGKKTFVIMLEHKSGYERAVSLQMARYNLVLIEYMLQNPEIYADSDGKVPSPYSFLFCQEHCPTFDDIVYRLGANKRYGMFFEYQTVDVSQLNLDDLRDFAYLFASFTLFRLAKEPLDVNWEEKKMRLFDAFDALASDLSTLEAQERYKTSLNDFLRYVEYFFKCEDKLDAFVVDLQQHEKEEFKENKMAQNIMRRFFAKELEGMNEQMQVLESRVLKQDEQILRQGEQIGEMVSLFQNIIVKNLQNRFVNAISPDLYQVVRTINNPKTLEEIWDISSTAPLETIETRINSLCR